MAKREREIVAGLAQLQTLRQIIAADGDEELTAVLDTIGRLLANINLELISINSKLRK